MKILLSFFVIIFFQKFGASVFSQDTVNKTEQVLEEIDRSIGKTKVIIGIHTHKF